MTGPSEQYIGIRLEGGLLPSSLLERVAAGSRDLKGAAPADYHLAANERLGDAASRKWLYLRGVYQSFRDRLNQLPDTTEATSQTREHWLLVLLGEFGFGRVPFVRSIEVAEKAYPVSHLWEQRVPMHLVGWNTHLDKRGTQHGRAPQSMMQEFLNVSDAHLWGIVSNGRQLRLLRDSKALSGAAYIEFDLEAIFDGELYSEFLLLFALLHESRFEPLPRDDDTAPTPGDCWIEKWRVDANETGLRARDRLRDGVEKALAELGTGFLEANPRLCADLDSGRLTQSDLRHELLRLAYQLIFLFVTEDRGLLHDPDATTDAIGSYQRYFSTARLRRISRVRRGDRNRDLWRTQVVVLDALGTDDGQPALGLLGLGGLFFRPADPGEPSRLVPDLLRDAELRNERLLAAVRYLDQITDDRGRPQRVDYQHLGTEELGSVYESLLELEPVPDTVAPSFSLAEKPGNPRKTTGSYYTPRVLVDTLLDDTLDPLLAEAAKQGAPADLLALTVCDPACGSGAFLVGAARRIATKIAALKALDDEPSPRAVAAALHDVVARCLYGVDVNPLAAELAKVSLWLESQIPGLPLAFLDNRIKVGNSLLGVTPKLLEQGIPDGAFKPIEGDDPKIALSLRRQNEAESGAWIQDTLDFAPGIRVSNFTLAERVRKLSARPRLSLAGVREQIREFQEFEADPELRQRKTVASAWCAAFVWRKHGDAPEAITTEHLRRLDAGKSLPRAVSDELGSLTREYQFFHWHLEFPDVFRVVSSEAPDHNAATGWQGGFSCVVGNPPWERVKLQEQEFFATSHRPDIAKAKNAAARQRLIERLPDSDDLRNRELYVDFKTALRKSDGWSQLLRETDRYPLTGHGDINTYSVFAETARTIVSPTGRAGMVLPTGIGTDATTAPFFGDLVRKSALVAFLEFENEAWLLSRAVHHSFRFCLLCMAGRPMPTGEVSVAFGVRYIADLAERRLAVRPRDLLLVNPNTGTMPLFRFPRDAEITLGIYARVPVLWRDKPDANPWEISFMAMFHMANDSRLFRTDEELLRDGWKLDGNVFVKGDKRMLPLYEAKMIHHFDHRYGTYDGQTEAQANVGTLPRPAPEEKRDPCYVIMPRYWVQEFSTKNDEKSKPGKVVVDAGVTARLETRSWDRGWLFGWRDICRSTDERTIISSAIPRMAVGDKYLLAFTDRGMARLQANLSSFVLDFCARQKYGGTSFKYYLMKQLPVLAPHTYDQPTPWEGGSWLADWIEKRVLELTYTAWDMEPFARDLGDDRPPFVWDEKRRFAIRAELDAAYFHLYGVEADDVDYIMDAFPTVNKRDAGRTKREILGIFKEMADAIDTGVPYRSALDPAPGRGARHPARQKPETR
jgi:Eco57I restriction-modification methylase